MSNNRQRGLRCFTLIELLVVIAIIAILAGLLLGGLGRARLQGQIHRARNGVQELASSFRSMENEYGSYPWTDERPHPVELYMVRVLAGSWNDGSMTNNLRYYNTRMRVYMQFKPSDTNSSGSCVDPWGSPYWFIMDGNGDGIVTNPFVSNATIRLPLIVWSYGPNRTNDRLGEASAANTDNIKSY
jgi:prepilin-type N-terminal cleavage/methylation domain-containing protein